MAREHMKKRYTYAECYRILDIDPACTWDELRRSYKLQIHKWHPDRYTDKSAEKAAADDKIKRITTAHQQLVTYFRQHGKLPAPETPPAPQKLPQPDKMHPRAATSSSRAKHAEPPVKKTGLVSVVGGIILAGTLFWFYLTSNDVTSTMPQPSASATSAPQIKSKPDFDSNQHSQIATRPEQQPTIAEDEFITYGSSIGEVIAIQGAPTDNIGDTWYYGNSELYFENGKVVGWKHASDSKLKTGIVTKKIP
jgi:hypothetical protein